MIIKLPDSISSQIAAGEVVERPASVVKELVENSIDAGATKIVVEIEAAGKELIKVSDNGHGIASSDIPLLFERHATSKIKTIEDIYSIYSLGFRGEALNSISSVSKVLLISKTEDDEIGKKVVYNDGEIKSIEPYGTTVGTSIAVSDIFYNIPVRYKFLESDSREKAKIVSLMTRLSLSRPDISFTLLSDGREEIRTRGKGGLYSALHSVYGSELSSKLIEVKLDTDGLRVSGYIALPEYTKGNKSMQVIFVNGRYIESKELQKTVTSAYEGLLMLHRHPVFFLSIEVNSDEVDVNIHPQKIELKFENYSYISNKVYTLVKNTLYEYSHNRKFSLNKVDDFAKNERLEAKVSGVVSKILSSNEDNSVSEDFYIPSSPIEEKDPVYDEVTDFDFMSEDDYSSSFIGEDKFEDYENKVSDEDVEPNLIDRNYISSLKEMTIREPLDDSVDGDEDMPNDGEVEYKEPEKFDESIYDDVTVIGQIFNTFVVAQKDDKAYFIDQHAAHEKVLYEKFVDDFNKRVIPSQYLINPYVYTFSADNGDIVQDALELLRSLSVDVEKIDASTYKILNTPVFITPVDIEDIAYILDSYKKYGNRSFEKLIDPILAMKSCKAAIKANDVLTLDEMKELFRSLGKLRNPNNCPHGRPILFEISKKEFEKYFKRIV